MAQIAANLQRIKNGQRRYAITPRVPAGFIQQGVSSAASDVYKRQHYDYEFESRRRR